MKFLIINTDYPEFLGWLYRRIPGLENRSYDEQMQVRNESLFGVADFYSANLNKLGHEAFDVHANNVFLQKAWAREHNIAFDDEWEWRFRMRRKVMPWFYRARSERWLYDVLREQIRHYKPDILINQDLSVIGGRFLREVKPGLRMIIGQIACHMPEQLDLRPYDLILSSLPNYVDYFRKKGVSSELHRLGFEPRVLEMVAEGTDKIPVSFVGSFSRVHRSRIKLLKYLYRQVEIQVWGANINNLPFNSPIRHCYRGNAWGVEMYRILRDSKVTLNNHEGLAGPFANNMRLYEATGCGTLLITDWKENLREMFEPGKEVVTYCTPEECAEQIRYYLNHEEERKNIAAAGQQRTLRNHTYHQRAEELVDIVKRYRK